MASWSFQKWLTHLPIRKGGLGIRSLEGSRLAAFIGALELSVPHFTNSNNLMPQLSEILGYFTENGVDRWSPLIQSESRTGKELAYS